MPGTRDVIDWPEGARDGYVMNNASSIIAAYAYGSLQAIQVWSCLHLTLVLLFSPPFFLLSNHGLLRVVM